MAKRARILFAGIGAWQSRASRSRAVRPRRAARRQRADSAADDRARPRLGAAWLDSGRLVGLVTLGSSTCVPGLADEAKYADGILHVELAAPEADKACTSDLVPRVTLVGVPQDVDPEEDLQIEVTGDDYFGQVELEGVPGLDPGGETDYEPSAGWATTEGQFVILTWGSSTCIPVIEDVAATGPAAGHRDLRDPADNQVCTMDMVPRGEVTAVNDLEEAAMSPPSSPRADSWA